VRKITLAQREFGRQVRLNKIGLFVLLDDLDDGRINLLLIGLALIGDGVFLKREFK
jgi:hypothetical protein